MVRQRSLSLILTSLVLVAGCSSRSSAPGSAGEKVGNSPGDAAGGKSEDAAAGAMPGAMPEATDNKRMVAPKPEPEPALDDAVAAEHKAVDGEAEEAAAIAGSQLEIAEPMISGGLDRDLIRRKALDHEDEIKACHAKALVDNPELFGTLAIELKVDARGVVEDVELGPTSELGERELVDCVLEAVSGWSFVGEATSKASVELSFKLSAPS